MLNVNDLLNTHAHTQTHTHKQTTESRGVPPALAPPLRLAAVVEGILLAVRGAAGLLLYQHI